MESGTHVCRSHSSWPCTDGLLDWKHVCRRPSPVDTERPKSIARAAATLSSKVAKYKAAKRPSFV